MDPNGPCRNTPHHCPGSCAWPCAFMVGTPSPGGLPSALEPRATMDAAVSLIMLQNRCSHDSADQLMHFAACDSNRGLNAIAQDILKQAATDVHRDGTS
jgi:hypothetical protein